MTELCVKMRLICFWCAVVVMGVWAQEEEFYAPQTFKQHLESYQQGMFTPSQGQNDVTPQGSEPWRQNAAPAPVHEWRGQYSGAPAPALPKPEPWRAPYQLTKEQQATILHHKQALTSEGSFRFEYASDNGLQAGEVIEPDGSRVGAYQYKDPSGQLVKLKYRAGKEGFQILEGSHLPKSPEPVAPATHDAHYVNAYEQQRQQYELQQNHNQQQPQQQGWSQDQNEGQRIAQSGPSGYVQSWRPQGQEDDGQYRENEVESEANKGPHTFGEGYAFAFQG